MPTVIDSKTVALYASAILIIIVGILVSKGLLDVSTQSMIEGLLIGVGTGGTAGYAAGRSSNRPTAEQVAILEEVGNLPPQ